MKAAPVQQPFNECSTDVTQCHVMSHVTGNVSVTLPIRYTPVERPLKPRITQPVIYRFQKITSPSNA